MDIQFEWDDDKADDMPAEYNFDYRKARPNRFAVQLEEGQRVITLDPDIAKVFTTSEAVNAVLRALIETMPKMVERETA